MPAVSRKLLPKSAKPSKQAAQVSQQEGSESESDSDSDFDQAMLDGDDDDDDEEAEMTGESDSDSEIEQGEEGDSEEEEEEDDVTEEAMAKMMELLGDDAEGLLDDIELEEEDGEEEGEDSDEELDDEEAQDEQLFEDVDEDDVDFAPQEKTTVNDKVALERVLASFKTKTTFFDTLTLTYPQPLNIPDAENDLERELEFYKQSLWAATEAQKLFAAANVPFSRPSDYFAEMVKSDDHMSRIRQSLLNESAGIKASEDARKLRDAKKFGKKVQVERLKEREKEKKEVGKRLESLKKKRKNGEGLSTEDFDIALEDAIAGPSKRAKPNESERGGRGGKRGISRQGRNSKFGNPTTSRRPKENNDKTDGDGFSRKSRGGARGGRGGSRGGGRGRGGARGGAKPRLGKSRRN